MDNYYDYNPLYTRNWYHGYNQSYREEPRQIALRTDMAQTITQKFNDGFTRYNWPNIELIKPREYVDFRLITPIHENVISAGNSTNPVENIYPIQITPLIEQIEQRNVMAMMLHNQSPDSLLVDLWVVTK
ncbi:hypothetical protein LAV73_21895 [Lysinibacillus xylanilyticus]|uniref:hypothetical protein n=1 Tax=Lysinibacillus xylanilyticus TaxID=582475 RepID=UPI002B247929|nr:hypothetical protein [Lysinibacillus xylanilyticus]MEB2282583.1 hypothetical protein [Lysinibacillus xylanilyticus]